MNSFTYNKYSDLDKCFDLDYIIFTDSLRSEPRRHEAKRDFFSFKKGDKNPFYEILFSGDGATQLGLLKAVISTNLKHLDGTVNFFNGSTLVRSEVCDLCHHIGMDVTIIHKRVNADHNSCSA